jgi:hypothetical protein
MLKSNILEVSSRKILKTIKFGKMHRLLFENSYCHLLGFFVSRQHRKILIEWMQDPSKDLRLTEIVLSQDAKNYHAWQHRQWIVKTFK